MTQPVDRPFIIPIFIPHWGCSHQCVFCNQHAITSIETSHLSSDNLSLIIENALKNKAPKRKTVQIAFYGGNFLGLKTNYILSLLKVAASFVFAGKVDSIRFSTRPDTVNKEKLDLLGNFPVSTIELGVQSMDDGVLALANRGHTSLDTEKTFLLLKEYKFETGLQMMVGLPGDDGTQSIETGRKLASFSPDFVRIYPTLVLADSPLAIRYQKGKFTPISLEKCVTLVKQLYHIFNDRNIRIIRMGLQASEEIDDKAKVLAGPYHPAFGHMVFSEIFLDMAIAALKQKKINGHYKCSSKQYFQNERFEKQKYWASHANV